MLLIISPSKIQQVEGQTIENFSQPELLAHSAELAGQL